MIFFLHNQDECLLLIWIYKVEYHYQYRLFKPHSVFIFILKWFSFFIGITNIKNFQGNFLSAKQHLAFLLHLLADCVVTFWQVSRISLSDKQEEDVPVDGHTDPVKLRGKNPRKSARAEKSAEESREKMRKLVARARFISSSGNGCVISLRTTSKI